MTVQIRPRTDADLPRLLEIVERQQPETEYPFVWPLPYDPIRFVRRSDEVQAWVAELDGDPVGHVALTSVADDDQLGPAWAAAYDCKISELLCISVLFADLRLAGRGIGTALLRTATEAAWVDGYPVLDVVAAHETPVALYRRNGWQVIDTQPAPFAPGQDIPIYLMVLPRRTP